MTTTTKRADELKVGDLITVVWGMGVVRQIAHKFGLIYVRYDFVYRNAADAGVDDKNWFYKGGGNPAYLPDTIVEVLTP